MRNVRRRLRVTLRLQVPLRSPVKEFGFEPPLELFQRPDISQERGRNLPFSVRNGTLMLFYECAGALNATLKFYQYIHGADSLVRATDSSLGPLYMARTL